MAAGLDSTLVAAIGLTVFLGGLIYLKVPKFILKALDDQSAKIALELNEAKRLRVEAEALLKSYEAQRVQAEADATAIISKARDEAIRLKTEAEAQLNASIASRGRQAEERIKRAEETALLEVRAAATNAAIATAEKVLMTEARGDIGKKLVGNSILSLAGKFG